ncbi:diguanylate cyclase [Clostridium tertium]|uniref:Putative diguanylate cyclase YcdT n=1 Tax=Clostridium tertium TaxID=1559 RepID=A0A6N3GVJ4_9CLOT
MEKFLYAEINTIGLAILATIYMKGRNITKSDLSQKMFNYLLYVTASLLVFDAAMRCLDGLVFEAANEILLYTTTIYYILTVAMVSVLLMYCDSKVYVSDGKQKLRFKIYMIPFYINAILSVISFTTEWIFRIDENNVYHRGELYWIHVLIIFIPLLYSIRMIIKGMKDCSEVKRNEFRYLILFLLSPVIGFIIQTFCYGLSIAHICCVISLLITFINIQSNLIIMDPLTQVNNRRAFIDYIKCKISKVPDECVLFLLMIDVDYFKKINDEFGHTVGDEALVLIVRGINLACTRNDFLSRIGGDEFAVVGQRRNEEEIKALILEIERKIEEVSIQENTEYKLSVSIGYSIYGRDGIIEISDFINVADKNMYEVKKAKKIKA